MGYAPPEPPPHHKIYYENSPYLITYPATCASYPIHFGNTVMRYFDGARWTSDPPISICEYCKTKKGKDRCDNCGAPK